MAAEKRASAKARKAVAAAAPARRGKQVEARAKKTAAKEPAAAPAKKKAKASTAVAKARAAAPKASAAVAKARAAAPKAVKAPKPGKPSKLAAASVSGAGGLGEGDRAPSFALHDHRGQTLSSDELGGKPYVIYFYPKDDTPGCTTQACGFRDTESEFAGVGARIVGVSPDSVASHQRFASKYGLPFTLLSDPEQELASQYGVWALKKNYGREYMGIVRSTFLVDAAGVIRKVWRGVRVNGHVAEVQAAAAALS